MPLPTNSESAIPAAPATGLPVGVLAFTSVYVVAATVAAVASGNWEFLFYIVTMIVLAAAVAAAHVRVGFSRAVLWGLSLWGLAHMAGGMVPVPESWPINGDVRVLYSWWIIPDLLKYDQVVHAYGFGVTTFVCWQGLQSILRDFSAVRPRPTFGMLTLCGAASMGFGALNEVIEFAATRIVAETNVGDYTNTGWDLVSNGVGAVFACLLIRVRESGST